MITSIAHFSLLVNDYDEAKDFYCAKLGFELVEDTPMGSKRWIRIRAAGSTSSEIVLVKASSEEEAEAVGKQAAGRVFLFLYTDQIDKDYERLSKLGVEFFNVPTQKPHGQVAVFLDLYGNKIDLIEPRIKPV